MSVSRRRFMMHGMGGCACCLMGASALAAVSPTHLEPMVTPGYQPTDIDERNLWAACAELEREVAASNLLITDPKLNGYVRGVVDRLLGETAKDIRIYIVRNPEFNASMTPNGMMVVHTGLLARMRNEAQLAAVLGHEAGHYLRRHSVQNWRSMKTKSATMAVVAISTAGILGGTGRSWYNAANAINNALLLSLFSFSRDLESEADAYGLKLLQEANYEPQAAAQVWEQLISERKASAAARNKRYRDRANSVFSTHPPTAERMRDLTESATRIERGKGDAAHRTDRKEEWLVSVGPMRASLLEEQIKLNDPGASLYLVNSLAQDGWDGTLHYFEGEAYRLRDEGSDNSRAAESYRQAVAFSDAPAEAYRAHGYAQLKAGNSEDGKRALTRYLDLKPDAADAAMVRFSLAQ